MGAGDQKLADVIDHDEMIMCLSVDYYERYDSLIVYSLDLLHRSQRTFSGRSLAWDEYVVDWILSFAGNMYNYQQR